MSNVAVAQQPSTTPVGINATLLLKIAAMVVVLGGVTAPVLWTFAQISNPVVPPATWALVVISAIANVIVIIYHYAIPPHPKFLMIPWRRWILRGHITGGTVELIAGLWACFGHSSTAAIVMALAALCLHVPTAFAQTTIVFGSKAVMVPAYLLCIVTHAFCAAMLLSDPSSVGWAVNTFLVFNIYVWCRIYFYAFDWLRLFSTTKYSISILAAGATMIPALFGALGFLLLAGFIAVYILLYKLLFASEPAAYADFVREKARDATIDRESTGLFEVTGTPEEDERATRAAFDSLDEDGDGLLTRDDLQPALSAWGLTATLIASLLDRAFNGQATLDRDGFARHIWTLGGVRTKAQHLVRMRSTHSERDKAQFVFEQIDVDKDGFIGILELELLLLEWGLPNTEAQRYMNRADASGDGRIDFNEFFQSLRPVWRYIYYDIYQAQDPRKNTEMIGRSASAIKASYHTRQVRQRLKEEILSQVRFLAGADERLLSDLAASLVPETFAAGTVVFSEGSVGDRFYLLVRGAVRVSKRGETISDLGVGGCLGEGALMSSDPRAATVTALSETMLYSLTRSSFEFITEKYPKVREQLRELHRDRLVAGIARTIEREMLGRVPFLKGASEELVGDLAQLLTTEKFQAGEVILREGTPGDRFYLVEAGAVQISKGDLPLATLGPGGCLGEGALLRDELRSATASAIDDTRLLTLSREAFHRILQHHPGVQMSLLSLHGERQHSPEAA